MFQNKIQVLTIHSLLVIFIQIIERVNLVSGSVSERPSPSLNQVYTSKPIIAHILDDKYNEERGRNMSKVLDELLSNYDARVRPTKSDNSEAPTDVYLDLNIRSMGPISEIDRIYAMDCYFRQTWRDPRLSYRDILPNQKMAIAVHVALLEKLWIPDTYFLNGKDSYVHMITTANKLLRIAPDGTILYSMRLTIKADCPMRLKAYPMDTQFCPLTILSFAHNSDELNLHWKYGNNQSIAVNDEVKLSQFDIISYSHTNLTTYLSDVTYSSLKVTFRLKRHMGYFLLQVYVPSVLLVMMSWVAFWLNREASSDRVGLGITVILTMTTMNRDNGKDLPEVPYATALELYVQLCFVFVIFSMVQFVGVHYFTKQGGGDYHSIDDSKEEELSDDDLTQEQIAELREEHKAEKERKKRLRKSALAQGISMISTGQKFKQETFWRKLLSCLLGSQKYRNIMRRRARKAGDGANSVSKLDKIARILFPTSFTIVNILYWVFYYLYEHDGT